MSGYAVYILYKSSGYLVPSDKGLCMFIIGNPDIGKLVC